MIIDDFFLSEEDKHFIDETVLGHNFPFFLQNVHHNDREEDQIMLIHAILGREEHRRPGQVWDTPFYREFIKIFKSFVDKHNIEYKGLFRACVNLSFKNNIESSEKHTDLTFPHKILIVYCNDCDPNATTTVFDDNKETAVYPKKYRGFCFDGQPHSFKFPSFNSRIVIVYNFQ